MTMLQLTPRQEREVAFYRQYAERQAVQQVDFEPVSSHTRRPWNAYWKVYEEARSLCRHPAMRLLEFGCGVGIASVRFAYLGYYVSGFDISPDNIQLSKQLAANHQLKHRCDFRVMPAETLSYPDNHFDVITGIDILHHVEIDKAIVEAYRVLKPGGVALFKEHVESPLVEPIRNSSWMQKLAPSESSLDDHITEDERKLTPQDLQKIRSTFLNVDDHRFTLTGRLERLLPRANDRMRGRLQRLDHTLLRMVPALRHLAGTSVLVCRKPHLAEHRGTLPQAPALPMAA